MVNKQKLTFTITREMLFQVDSSRKYACILLNTSCRRQLLMAQFSETTDVASPVPLHDVRAKQCGCQACTIDEDLALSTEDVEAFEQLSDNPEYSSTCTCTLSTNVNSLVHSYLN